jgi:hypothetical protein
VTMRLGGRGGRQSSCASTRKAVALQTRCEGAGVAPIYMTANVSVAPTTRARIAYPADFDGTLSLDAGTVAPSGEYGRSQPIRDSCEHQNRDQAFQVTPTNFLISNGKRTPARAAYNPREQHGREQPGYGTAYLIASGLVGEPTAPVIGIAGATNINS